MRRHSQWLALMLRPDRFEVAATIEALGVLSDRQIIDLVIRNCAPRQRTAPRPFVDGRAGGLSLTAAPSCGSLRPGQ